MLSNEKTKRKIREMPVLLHREAQNRNYSLSVDSWKDHRQTL